MLLYNKTKILAVSLNTPVEEEEQRNTVLRKLQPSQKPKEYYVMNTIEHKSIKPQRVKNIKTKVFFTVLICKSFINHKCLFYENFNYQKIHLDSFN